ncbi:amidohydrolase [Streptomyces mirabilis]|nr:amidohydrolase family protein [Streptomyces mirabilis]MCX4431448.1 amidohydrolase [Streptomyces mirabilis]
MCASSTPISEGRCPCCWSGGTTLPTSRHLRPPSRRARRRAECGTTPLPTVPRRRRAAVQAVGADRLVLGSDFPYQGGEHYLDTVAYIERAGLDAEDTQGILAGNAEALLGLA